MDVLHTVGRVWGAWWGPFGLKGAWSLRPTCWYAQWMTRRRCAKVLLGPQVPEGCSRRALCFCWILGEEFCILTSPLPLHDEMHQGEALRVPIWLCVAVVTELVGCLAHVLVWSCMMLPRFLKSGADLQAVRIVRSIARNMAAQHGFNMFQLALTKTAAVIFFDPLCRVLGGKCWKLRCLTQRMSKHSMWTFYTPLAGCGARGGVLLV